MSSLQIGHDETLLVGAFRRFLFVSVDAPPRLGGVASLSFNIAQYLTKLGASGSIFLGPDGTCFENQNPEFDVIVDFNSDTRLRQGAGSDLENERIKDLLVRLIQAYEIDHVFLFHPFYYGVAGTEAARECGITSSLYLHGTEVTSQIVGLNRDQPIELNNFLKPEESLPARLLKAINGADFLFTNSEYSKSLIEKLSKTKPITVTGCGIDVERLKEECAINPNYEPNLRNHAKLAVGLQASLTLVIIARLVPHKNINLAIELLSHLLEAQLIVVGEGPEETKLKQFASAIGVSDRILFAGNVSEDEKWRLLRAADVGLLISGYDEQSGGYEGFGIAMLEYAAAGCLVLSTGTHGMADFVLDHQAAVVGLKSPSTLTFDAAKLTQLYQCPSEMSRLVRHARKVIHLNFTWEVVARNILAAYAGEQVTTE